MDLNTVATPPPLPVVLGELKKVQSGGREKLIKSCGLTNVKPGLGQEHKVQITGCEEVI